MKIQPVVFWFSSILIGLFVLIGALFSDSLNQSLAFLQNSILEQLGWFYIASVAGFLLFVIWLYFSRYGGVKLGKDEDEPEFSYRAWFAMLFSAGMGIGLLFFSVAEPLMHFSTPPRDVAPNSIEAARQAMTVTFFHWGMHAWAIYIIIAAALAYFSFRHGLPLSLRSALYPLIGRHVNGIAGHVVDIIAVFGTVFGLATSLGLGIMQINSGLNYLGFIEISTTNQVVLIALITVAATISAATGLDRGIRRLSELNLTLAGVLLLFVLLTGPTIFLLSSFVQNIGRYAASLVDLTFRTDVFVGLEWQKSWTMFYWAWWISWSPFVGMFVARISRGRTLREFIGGVMMVPVMLTFFWMTVFGGTALYMELFDGVALAQAAEADLSTAIFVMLNELPISMISASLAILVVTIFFITSADSGALVIDTITSGDHPDRPAVQRTGWSVTVGAVAAVLLVSGGLAALQTAAIITALPFCAMMIVICVGLVKGLRAEVGTSDPFTELMQRIQRVSSYVPLGPRQRSQVTVPPAAPVPGRTAEPHEAQGPWNRRLAGLIEKVSEGRRSVPDMEQARQTVTTFIRETVVPAFEDIAAELRENGREAQIESSDQEASLVVLHHGQEEFAYGIYGHIYRKGGTAFPKVSDPKDASMVGKAEVVLRTGPHREYEIRQWTREGILEDFVSSYAKWMGW